MRKAEAIRALYESIFDESFDSEYAKGYNAGIRAALYYLDDKKEIARREALEARELIEIEKKVERVNK